LEALRQYCAGDPIEALANLAGESAGGMGIAAPPARVSGEERWDHRVISGLTPRGASVLDLGCGSGDLLAHLMEARGVTGQGIDVHEESVARCIARGVPVIQADIDQGLATYPDGSFDYVVLETTLQTVRRPMKVLDEIVRVGRMAIVSFPNFGYLPVRAQLLIRGHMPVTPHLPYSWADTPNIHLLTIRDFETWCATNGITVEERLAYAGGRVRTLTPPDNVLAEEALYVIRRGRGDAQKVEDPRGRDR
jgi:methionine biosynthesis protein MetW